MDEWDEEAIEQRIQEAINRYIQKTREAALQVYQELVSKAEEKEIEVSLSEGGDAYEKIKKKIIENAQAWYDAYPSPPRRYKRRGTLTDEKNIKISTDVSGGRVSLRIDHLSDQAEHVMNGFYIHNRVYTEGPKGGLWSVQRGAIAFRKGCNFLQDIDEKHMTMSVKLSKSALNKLYDQAMDTVLTKGA